MANYIPFVGSRLCSSCWLAGQPKFAPDAPVGNKIQIIALQW